MTELFYWKEMERRARAAQALAMCFTTGWIRTVSTRPMPSSTSFASIGWAPNG
jgi:hypothetical protein